MHFHHPAPPWRGCGKLFQCVVERDEHFLSVRRQRHHLIPRNRSSTAAPLRRIAAAIR
jgi:hypothetical protein